MSNSKFFKIISVGVFALTLTVFMGGVAKAITTVNANALTNDGALTITGATASTWSTTAGALTLTSAAAATWSTAAGVLTLTGTGGLTLDSGTTTAVNLGTGAAAKTITIGNAASTLLDLDAISIDIDGAGTGVTIDALDAGSINLGTSAVAASDTSPINIGTSATARTITLGGGVLSNLVVNGRLSTGSVAGSAITLDSTYTQTEGAELRYTVTDWTGIGATNTFKGLYLRPQVNTAAAAGNLKGIEVNTTNNGVALGSMHGAYLETQVKAIAANATVGPIYGIESQISLYAPTAGTLTLTEQSDVGVAAGRFQLGIAAGLADYTSVYGVLIQSNDASAASRTLGSGLLIRNFPAEGTQTWTKAIQVTAPAVTGLSLEGAMTTGISIVNTATTGINFAGGAANQAIKVGALSSTVPGSGAVISDTNNRAMDINVDDNNVASADTAKLLSVARFRLMRYANSVAEDYAVHGLVKYSELTKSRFGAGVMGAAETTGAVTLSDLTTGVLGRFGTAATLTLTGAGDRIAAVTAFNNNSVALAGSGKSAGLLVMETDVGTPIDLDYGLEIRNNVATTGIKIGTTTTDIELQNGETINNVTNNQFLFSAPGGANTVTINAADSDANAALIVRAGGTGALTLGNAANTSVTIATDGTGDGEVVLPGLSVGESELTASSGFGLGVLRTARAKYDFAVDGGAISTITPATNATIPDNAVIVAGTINSTTTATSGGSATIAVGTSAGSSTTSLLGATAVASFGADSLINSVATHAAAVKLTAAGSITLTIATATLTAGVIEVTVFYYVAAN